MTAWSAVSCGSGATTVFYKGKMPDGRDIYYYGGDHNEWPHDGNFCMDGLVSLTAARTPGCWSSRTSIARRVL